MGSKHAEMFIFPIVADTLQTEGSSTLDSIFTVKDGRHSKHAGMYLRMLVDKSKADKDVIASN